MFFLELDSDTAVPDDVCGDAAVSFVQVLWSHICYDGCLSDFEPSKPYGFPAESGRERHLSRIINLACRSSRCKTFYILRFCKLFTLMPSKRHNTPTKWLTSVSSFVVESYSPCYHRHPCTTPPLVKTTSQKENISHMTEWECDLEWAQNMDIIIGKSIRN